MYHSVRRYNELMAAENQRFIASGVLQRLQALHAEKRPVDDEATRAQKKSKGDETAEEGASDKAAENDGGESTDETQLKDVFDGEKQEETKGAGSST